MFETTCCSILGSQEGSYVSLPYQVATSPFFSSKIPDLGSEFSCATTAVNRDSSLGHQTVKGGSRSNLNCFLAFMFTIARFGSRSLLHLYYSAYWFKATQIFSGHFVSVADDADWLTLYWFPSDGGFSAPPDFLSSHPRGWPACPEQNRGCYGIFLNFLQWTQPVKLSYFQQGPLCWYCF